MFPFPSLLWPLGCALTLFWPFPASLSSLYHGIRGSWGRQSRCSSISQCCVIFSPYLTITTVISCGAGSDCRCVDSLTLAGPARWEQPRQGRGSTVAASPIFDIHLLVFVRPTPLSLLVVCHLFMTKVVVLTTTRHGLPFVRREMALMMSVVWQHGLILHEKYRLFDIRCDWYC